MQDINFKYIFDNDYNPKYVNGAFGGIGPQGEIVMHFYYERGAIPYQINHNIEENGSLSAPTDVKPDDIDKSFVRFIQSGVILDRKHATEIYNWLGRVLGENNEE